ncbi:hypothetical protein RKD18_000339 [Streptomyces phaeoluteigriseus]
MRAWLRAGALASLGGVRLDMGSELVAAINEWL